MKKISLHDCPIPHDIEGDISQTFLLETPTAATCKSHYLLESWWDSLIAEEQYKIIEKEMFETSDYTNKLKEALKTILEIK